MLRSSQVAPAHTPSRPAAAKDRRFAYDWGWPGRRTSESRRYKDEASRAAANGDWAAAAELYSLLEACRPSEGTWPLRLGECWRRLDKKEEAIAALTRALKLFVRQHKTNKAAAVYRLMQELDPRNPHVPAALESILSLRTDEPEPVSEPAAPGPSAGKREGRESIAAPTRAPPSGAASPRPRVVMPRTPFLSAMTEGQLRAVNQRAHLLDVPAGRILYVQGDRATALLLVAAGQIALLLPQEVSRLRRGDFFGEEIAVLPDQPCLATARAVEASQVLALERELVDHLVGENPALLDILSASLRERPVRWQAATSPWLAALGPGEREALLARFHLREVARGRPFYDSRDREAGLVLLLAGEASASVDGATAEPLRPGDIFGEIALLTPREVAAVATARTTCLILHLPRAELAALRAAHAAMVDHLGRPPRGVGGDPPATKPVGPGPPPRRPLGRALRGLPLRLAPARVQGSPWRG